MESLFAAAREDMTELEESAWRLLTLERDISADRARPLMAESDRAALLRQYRTLSMRLFGQVRPDRE